MSLANSTLTRTLALCVCLIGATVALAQASKIEDTPLRERLSGLPMTIGEFAGTRAPNLEPAVLEVLGLDDYVNRTYRSGPNHLPTGLYLAYWSSQRQGDTIHSPMNCLPGSGWQPIDTSRIAIPMGETTGEVNRVVIEKSGQRLLVYYWYQSQGRVVASEYWSKIHMVVNAMRTNRTDAAMVRIVVPIPDNSPAAERVAEQEARTFVQKLFPLLGRYLPA
jgi:EpsI family protein